MPDGICGRVFVIGLDVARGPAVAEAETPHIDFVMADGLRTYHAQTVFPSVNFEAWDAMFHGANPRSIVLSAARTNEPSTRVGL